MQRLMDFMIGAGILQGIFQALVLWFSKKKDRLLNRVLSLLVAVFTLNLLHSLFRTSVMPSGSVIEPFQLLLGPMLYLYVRGRIENVFFRKSDFLHFIPFLLAITFLIVETSFSGLPSIKSSLGIGFWGALLLQISIYLFACGYLTARYNRRISDLYSDIQKRKMDWLHKLMSLLIVLYAGYFALFIILFHRNDLTHFERLLSFLQSLAVFATGYASFFHERDDLGETFRYEKSKLKQEDLAPLEKQLSELMEKDKPYLNPELTLPELADLTGIPRNTLSRLINERFGKNFYDFINAYRIEEVIRLMRDPRKSHYKMIALAFEAGFNSKPAFNAVFKKNTGLTPSGYRKKLSN